jgi:hypothetical protein
MHWKRLSRKKGQQQQVTSATPAASARPQDLPALVLVGNPAVLAAAAAERPKLLRDDQTLGLFSLEQSDTAQFREAFRIGELDLYGRFEAGVLYHQHLDRSRADYFPVDQFEGKMAEAKYNEMVEIARHIRAHTILVDGSSMEQALRARDLGVNLFLPVAAAAGPLAAGLLGGSEVVTAGAGLRHNTSGETTHDRGMLVCFERQQPDQDTCLPPSDVIPEGWYFYRIDYKQGGFKNTQFEKLVSTAMHGDYSARTLEVDFATVDHSLQARAFSFELGMKILGSFEREERTPSDIAGAGISRVTSNDNTTKVHYKFKIEMFDADVYKTLKRLSRTEQATQNERIRRTSGDLATLRWRNYRLQPTVRQDLVYAGARAVPDGETNQGRAYRYCLFGEYVTGVFEGGGNYVNVPLTMYGLEGEGRSWVWRGLAGALRSQKRWGRFASRPRSFLVKRNAIGDRARGRTLCFPRSPPSSTPSSPRWWRRPSRRTTRSRTSRSVWLMATR